MKQTEEKKEREVYTLPVIKDISPVTVTTVKGQEEGSVLGDPEEWS